ncbi:putative serine/threonine protein kinase ENV7 [Ascoidea rubescens DSM 1968]|uniref:non-specific serine/threonine protein kinase n=1 Tax=Ascoidea rubescens DSM 1968 TaxID=1344418 RepID=A0A1D2V8V3_9ASCO|nr:kinase-like protein [Ascoidea rubescens DSM 1968]ODV58082.1 kinase-like protein [Ascoidea rubescens DSM 1968]
MDELISLFCGCFPGISKTPILKINNAKFKILKLLGEGGFSYVYLVEASNGGKYALKKIRCPYGSTETVKSAINEINNYNEFHSPYIIRSIDSSIIEEKDGSKTIYILLPFFEKGSLQDLIVDLVINNQKVKEIDAIRTFIGIARGLQAMHRHSNNVNVNKNKKINYRDIIKSTTGGISLETLEINNSDAFINSGNDDGNDNDNDYMPYSHRDLKPANVMISKDGIPVLCDLGSCSKARIHIKNRNEAMKLQDLAAEVCTLPYRAPELLDVSSNCFITEKTDIWSLGCLLFAILFGTSPFEKEEAESGASMSLAISSGSYSIPNNNSYSKDIIELIKSCLNVEATSRPDIEEVLSKSLEIQTKLEQQRL